MMEAFFDALQRAGVPAEYRRCLKDDIAVALKPIRRKLPPLMDRCLVAFQFFMMCRPSEMWALTWEDVDLKSGRVLLNKAMRAVSGGFAVSSGSKIGPRGDRSAEMGETLTGLLRALRKAAMASSGQSNHVFTTLTGMPITGWRWNKNVWPRVRKNLELPDGPTFYSLKALGN
jgi:integrase